MSTWRDAPLFPTPEGALRGLATLAPLPSARPAIVDAGCGVGDGLRELHREYPDARIDGLEWSWPLRLASAWSCRFARVRRADIWTTDWSVYDMVYLFQRPESMPRASDKAARELRPGAWLASLEFEATALEPQQVAHLDREQQGKRHRNEGCRVLEEKAGRRRNQQGCNDPGDRLPGGFRQAGPPRRPPTRAGSRNGSRTRAPSGSARRSRRARAPS